VLACRLPRRLRPLRLDERLPGAAEFVARTGGRRVSEVSENVAIEGNAAQTADAEPTAAERATGEAHIALRSHLNGRRGELQRQISALENSVPHLERLRAELAANTDLFAKMGWETPEEQVAAQKAREKERDEAAQRAADGHPARTAVQRAKVAADLATIASIR
jgi:hypothetical protein